MTKVAELEALLFAEGGELKKKDLMRLLDLDVNTLISTSRTLTQVLSGHGIALVESENALALRTAPEYAELIKEIHKNSLEGELGKAGLETLAILLYRGHSTRAQIDHIRGVNSSFTIRSLMVRGLVERDKQSAQQYVYKPTIDAMSLLGVRDTKEIPEYEKISSQLHALENKEEVTHDTQNEQ